MSVQKKMLTSFGGWGRCKNGLQVQKVKNEETTNTLASENLKFLFKKGMLGLKKKKRLKTREWKRKWSIG